MPPESAQPDAPPTAASTDSPRRFSLVVGGPFHLALRRLGLTAADLLPTWRAAVGLALLAWILPAIAAVTQTLVDPGYAGWGYFSDLTVYTRYLVAISVMIATERYADGRIVLLTEHFREARLLTDDAQTDFVSALAVADRRSSSRVAEAVLFASAFAWSGVVEHLVVELTHTGWEGNLVGDAVVLSWAGEVMRFVSNPLFLFLVFRWLWRFAVWTALLFAIARLPLRLTPLHPDRSAGLGFLAIYPSIFSGLLFALSCVVSSSIIKDLAFERHSLDTVWVALLAWLALSMALFLGPLLAFVGPIYEARERALLEYGRLATHHHLAFHRKWVEQSHDGEELMGSTDPSSAADLNASVETARGLHLVPVDRAAVLQLLVAAGVPLLAVIANQVPLAEVLQWIFGTIL